MHTSHQVIYEEKNKHYFDSLPVGTFFKYHNNANCIFIKTSKKRAFCFVLNKSENVKPHRIVIRVKRLNINQID